MCSCKQDIQLRSDRHSNFLSFRAVRSQILGKPWLSNVFSFQKGAVWPTTITIEQPLTVRSSTDTLPRNSSGAESRGPSFDNGDIDSEALVAKSSDIVSDVQNADNIFSSDLKLFYNIFVTSALKSGGFSGHEDSILHEAFFRSSAGSVWFTRFA